MINNKLRELQTKKTTNRNSILTNDNKKIYLAWLFRYQTVAKQIIKFIN